MNTRQAEVDAAFEALKLKGFEIEQGLSDDEVVMLECVFNFSFPADVRFVLQQGLPRSGYFVNWRGPIDVIKIWFDRPVNGVLAAVEGNQFWDPLWGERPEDSSAALERASVQLKRAPKLIPLGDPLFLKCIPAMPQEAGNPVFSIHQADVIHAGSDIFDYLRWFSRPDEAFAQDEAEGEPPTPTFSDDYREIEFWTDLARKNALGL